MKSNETNSQYHFRGYRLVSLPSRQQHRDARLSCARVQQRIYLTCVQLMNWHRPIKSEPGYYVPKSLALSLSHTYTDKVSFVLSPVYINVIRRYCSQYEHV